MSKRTQFQRTPEGKKTERMLQFENRIGRTLEEDYRKFYLEGGWGQKRLANRWGVGRNLIFGVHRGSRRNWVDMLHLQRKGTTTSSRVAEKPPKGCEICAATDVVLESAHWISARNGGSARADNILRLCPNCHKKLDLMEDVSTIRHAREILLLRAATTFMQSTSDRGEDTQRRLLALCTSIIQRRPQA